MVPGNEPARARRCRSVLASVHDRRDVPRRHRFGLGLSASSIRDPERRDRLLFISAIGQAWLTLLGAAGEACGLTASSR